MWDVYEDNIITFKTFTKSKKVRLERLNIKN